MKVMEEARAMMESPVKKRSIISRRKAGNHPKLTSRKSPPANRLDKGILLRQPLGHGLLLARRLANAGRVLSQVEYQYGPFKGSTCTKWPQRNDRNEKAIARADCAVDSSIWTKRGLLERTLVCIMTEILAGRCQRAGQREGKRKGFAEKNTGENLVLDSEKNVRLSTAISAVAIA